MDGPQAYFLPAVATILRPRGLGYLPHSASLPQFGLDSDDATATCKLSVYVTRNQSPPARSNGARGTIIIPIHQGRKKSVAS